MALIIRGWESDCNACTIFITLYKHLKNEPIKYFQIHLCWLPQSNTFIVIRMDQTPRFAAFFCYDEDVEMACVKWPCTLNECIEECKRMNVRLPSKEWRNTEKSFHFKICKTVANNFQTSTWSLLFCKCCCGRSYFTLQCGTPYLCSLPFILVTTKRKTPCFAKL